MDPSSETGNMDTFVPYNRKRRVSFAPLPTSHRPSPEAAPAYNPPPAQPLGPAFNEYWTMRCASQQRPGASQQRPGASQQRPGASQQRPGASQQRPGASQQRPGASQQRPGASQQRPGAPQQRPGPPEVPSPHQSSRRPLEQSLSDSWTNLSSQLQLLPPFLHQPSRFDGFLSSFNNAGPRISPHPRRATPPPSPGNAPYPPRALSEKWMKMWDARVQHLDRLLIVGKDQQVLTINDPASTKEQVETAFRYLGNLSYNKSRLLHAADIVNVMYVSGHFNKTAENEALRLVDALERQNLALRLPPGL